MLGGGGWFLVFWICYFLDKPRPTRPCAKKRERIAQIIEICYVLCGQLTATQFPISLPGESLASGAVPSLFPITAKDCDS